MYYLMFFLFAAVYLCLMVGRIFLGRVIKATENLQADRQETPTHPRPPLNEFVYFVAVPVCLCYLLKMDERTTFAIGIVCLVLLKVYRIYVLYICVILQ